MNPSTRGALIKADFLIFSFYWLGIRPPRWRIAARPKATVWDQIDWPQCERQVRRLQARIVKATQEGRWNKVKALQRLLTCSFSGKALAVKRVTDNQGRRTSGVDGKVWNSPASKHKAFGTLRRVHIPKAKGKLRPLGIPTMKDRAMQALRLLALEPVAETSADKNSYGFRPGRSKADTFGRHAAAWGDRDFGRAICYRASLSRQASRAAQNSTPRPGPRSG